MIICAVMAVFFALLPVVLAVRKHFRGVGLSPGPLGASVFALIFAYLLGLPIWGCVFLAVPAAAMLDFAPWMLTYYVLERISPRNAA